jgi:site-specific DNA-methyltransferase (adenine-specific)/site-specific DNA-methyltransferase (cytosine-N4-specific)
MKKTKTNSATITTNPVEQQPDSINEPKLGYSESDLQPTLLQTGSNPVQNIQNFSYINQIIQGDCQEILKLLPDKCVDLIVTSPPYADQRSTTYGGIPPDMYVDWFIPKADQFLRVLKSTGSFILNIKERVVNGERHTYVMELVIKLRQHGWFWTEEYMWHKKNSHPGKWPNRFRDNWEHLYHFTKQKQFSMYQDTVMIPVGDWAQERLKNLSETDKRRDNSRVGSGFGKNISNWVGREMVYPSNVLHMATECYNRQHSATFPIALPEWFIKLFTQEGDLVLDPFNGSGTTCVAAKRLKRNWLGIDTSEEYCQVALDRILNDKNGNGKKKENNDESIE